MERKTWRNVKRSVANFFGAFGYLFCSLQWFWAILLYSSAIQSVILLIAPNADSHIEHPAKPVFALPSSVEVIILAIVVVVMIIVTVYVLMKIPASIVKTGNNVVYKTAETITPLVVKVQHKKDTKKFRSKIAAELMPIIKLFLVVIPVGLTFGSSLVEKQSISYSIALIVGSGLACLSVIFFSVQYMLASVFHVKLKDLF
jgi:hypothetical protein